MRETDDPGEPVRVAVMAREEVIERGLAFLLADHPRDVRAMLVPPNRVEAAAVQVVLYHAHGLVGGRIRWFRQLVSSPVPVLLYGGDLRADLVATGLAGGAVGHVPITASSTQLVAALCTVARGDRPPRISGPLLPGDVELTARQVEILAYLGQGLSNQAIAQELSVSPNTLKSHLRTMYDRLGVSSRSEALSLLLRPEVSRRRDRPPTPQEGAPSA